VTSLFGEVVDATGKVIARWALGEVIKRPFWKEIVMPGGEILAGKFYKTHDEL